MTTTFTRERDDYGRSVHVARADGETIGRIARLPKRTYPIPTYLVNDYRITRPLAGTPAYADAIRYVGTLGEAKRLLAA